VVERYLFCTAYCCMADATVYYVTSFYRCLVRLLLSTPVQAKPATLLIPIDFSFLFEVEELYGTFFLILFLLRL